MKDLKHLIFFENLLQEANNEMVQEAVKEGQLALGWSCYYIPEVLMNLPGCFGSRLRAPNTGSIDVSTYYMSPKICSYTRSLLERGIEGGFDYLSALFSAETCQMMHRGHEHFELLNLVKKEHPNFFMSMMDVPFVDGPKELAHYKEQIQFYILDRLHEAYGIDVSEKALKQAIEAQNEINAIISEIGEYRKMENPPITGYEFHVIQLVTQVCPTAKIKPYLQETLKEIKKRKPDPKPWYRTRIVLAGSEIDDPAFTKLIEDCGAFVVADRYCWGSLPSRSPIKIEDGETALDAIARYYLMSSECPRFMHKERSERRREYVRQLCREYNASGVLYEQMKFCEFWSYERVLANHVFNEEFGIPCLGIEKEYTMSGAGQTRTRVQAFVESLEIKEIQKEGK